MRFGLTFQAAPREGRNRFRSVLNCGWELDCRVAWEDIISIPAPRKALTFSRRVTSRAGLSEAASRLWPKATPVPARAIPTGSDAGSQRVWAARGIPMPARSPNTPAPNLVVIRAIP